MKKMKLLIGFVILSSYMGISAQNSKTVEYLEKQCQLCLDKGLYMLGCSQQYYYQMDSLMNVVYKELRSSCDSIQKKNLKLEQLKWLKKRDGIFKKNLVEVQKENRINNFIPQDDEMIMIQGNGDFVKERVLKLMKMQSKDYSFRND